MPFYSGLNHPGWAPLPRLDLLHGAGGAHMQPHGDSSDDEEDNFVDDNGDWNYAFDVNLDEY